MTYNVLLDIARPLVCDSDEINSLLNGYKIQRRNFIKYKNTRVIGVSKDSLEIGEPYNFQIIKKTSKGNITTCVHIKPKFNTGDICYVRETYFNIKNGDDIKYYYRADATPEIEHYRIINKIIWKPSAHMSIKAARLFVRVSAQRAEESAKLPGVWKWFYEFERIIPEDKIM
jgi:hypothetical protein